MPRFSGEKRSTKPPAVADENYFYHIEFLSQIAVKGLEMPHFADCSGIKLFLTERSEKVQLFAKRGKSGKSLVV